MIHKLILTKEKFTSALRHRKYSGLFSTALMLLLTIFMWQCKKDDYTGETKGVCPQVVSTIPGTDTTNVLVRTKVTVLFNEAMNPSTINTTTFSLVKAASAVATTKAASTPLLGTVTYAGMTATLSLDTQLEPATKYTGTVTKGAQDPDGNALKADYTWSFTTAPLYTVVLASNPLLGGTMTGAGSYNLGDSISVAATANAGFTFTNWTDAATVVSSNAIYKFKVGTNRSLAANFTSIPYTVALSSLPVAGGTTTGAGVFNSGASVTVKAVPAVGYVFTNWTDGAAVASTDANYTFGLTVNRTLVAHFALAGTQLTLALSPNPLLGGTTNGAGSFNSGASVTATAVHAVGYTFTNWTEGVTIVSTNAIYTFPISANRTLVANFTIIPANNFALNVTAVNGSVLANPDQATYLQGASVVLTATPNSGYSFTSWSGDATGSASPLTVVMNANKNITANFTLIAGAGPLAVNLGSAGNFAILGGSGVSNTGVTTQINGDVGSFPTSTINGLLSGNVNGTLYMTADPIVGQAKIDLTTAFNDAQARSTNAISLPGQLGGLTLAPGLYVNGSTSGISGTGANGILTLDAGGDANAVWIFKMASTFVTDAGTSIVLAGGAQSKNIFWSVGSSATLGTNSIFYGTILADQAVTLTTGATLYGRALARIAAVTLDSNTVTKP